MHQRHYLDLKYSLRTVGLAFEARMRRYLVEVIALYFIEKFQGSNTEEGK